MHTPSQVQESRAADPMAGRIARFADVQRRGIPLMFIDSILPGHQRMNYALIGDTASENPEFDPLIAAPHGFQIGMVKARPGNGPAYHTHDYVESFLMLSGRWRFYWGADPDPAKAEGEAILGPWDYVTLPPGLYRGFEVAPDETEEAWLFAVLENHSVFTSKDPIWSPQVVAQADEYGFHADESGKMITPANYEAVRAELLARLDGPRR
ncbi:MAG: cupin domain-containing protein [Chloroflexia bacterium]